MQPGDEMTDALAEKIFSGTVGGVLNTPLTWKQKNVPKKASKPIHVEAWAPLKTDLSCRLELRMRIGLDVAWEYTLLVLHPSASIRQRCDGVAVVGWLPVMSRFVAGWAVA